MNEFVIIANGDFLIKEILLEIIQNKTIIALDGAMNVLYTLGIHPHVLLGDFDSILPSVAAHVGVKKNRDDMQENDKPYEVNKLKIIPALNQQFTDLTKAIHYCDQKAASSITLVCALGGRLDHHENNLRCLRSEYQKNRPIFVHTEQQTIRFAKNETIQFSGKSGDHCGFLAFPKAIISTKGLVYDVEDALLDFAFAENVCNVMREDQASVEVIGEALIVMPPFFPSQREFMQKTPEQQLTLKLRDIVLKK